MSRSAVCPTLCDREGGHTKCQVSTAQRCPHSTPLHDAIVVHTKRDKLAVDLIPHSMVALRRLPGCMPATLRATTMITWYHGHAWRRRGIVFGPRHTRHSFLHVRFTTWQRTTQRSGSLSPYFTRLGVPTRWVVPAGQSRRSETGSRFVEGTAGLAAYTRALARLPLQGYIVL